MKKLVYLLILAVMLPAALHSQVLVNENNDAMIKSNNPSSVKLSKEALETNDAKPVIKNRDSKIQAVNWVQVGPVVGASVYNGGLATNRIAYDPFSGILIFPNYANIRYNEDYNDGGPYGEIRLTFTDEATSSNPTFQTTPIFGLDDNYMLNPSLTVLNTRNATDISGLDMFIVPWTAELRPPDTSQFWFNGVAYGVYDGGTQTTMSDIYDVLGPYKDKNGQDILGKLRYTPDYYTTGHQYEDGDIYYYHVSRTVAEMAYQSEYPGGAYAFAYLKGDASDFDSYISPKWSPDRFASFGGGNISAAMLTDVDPAGNIYIMTNNVQGNVNILEQDPEWVWRRLPGFFKSTDRGATWSDVDTVPRAKIEAWITSKGGNSSPNNRMFDTQLAYGQAGLIVLGEDHLIYATPIRVVYPDNTLEHYIISIEYNNGEWDVEEISQLHIVETMNFYDDPVPVDERNYPLLLPVTIADRELTTTDNDTLQTDYFAQKSRLWEIEMALTNDGNVICKWNGFRTENAPISSPIYLLGDPITNNSGEIIPHGFFPETGIYTTDIFTSYKKVGEDGWSEPNNITNDAAFNKFSMMPNRVPSLENVPIFELQTAEFYTTTERGVARAQAGYPAFFLNWFSDHSRQNVMYANFDITIKNSVETALESNVEVLNPYPNPAINLAELAVNLEAPALVTITVYDAMGNKVADVHSDYVGAGFKSFTLNTEKYATGAYYVNYTIDGVKAATKMLNVVK